MSFVLFVPPVSADGGAPQLAYIAGGAQGISVIDITQRGVSRTMTLKDSPSVILLSLDGSTLFVTQPLLGTVVMLAAKTGKTLCSVHLLGHPSLLALSLDATVLFVAGKGDTSVRALNPQNCAVQRTFETHQAIYGLAVAASTAIDATPLTPNQLWITGDNQITVFEVNGNLLGTIPFAEGPQAISTPAGFTAYVTTRQGDVVAIDLNARKIIRTLLSGGQFGPMDYDATTGEVYVPDLQHNILYALNPITVNTTIMPHEPSWTLNLNSSPQSIAITSDGQLGFVALSDGQVLMLDIPGHAIITGIQVGGTPHFVITGLYPPLNLPTSPVTQVTNTSPSAGITNLPLIIFSVLIVLIVAGSGWFLWRRSHKRDAI